MNLHEIKSKVIVVISQLFLDEHLDMDILQDLDLIDDLGMDSLTFIAMIVEVENVFGITVPDEKLMMDNFRSVDRIVQNIDDVL